MKIVNYTYTEETFEGLTLEDLEESARKLKEAGLLRFERLEPVSLKNVVHLPPLPVEGCGSALIQLMVAEMLHHRLLKSLQESIDVE